MTEATATLSDQQLADNVREAANSLAVAWNAALAARIHVAVHFDRADEAGRKAPAVIARVLTTSAPTFQAVMGITQYFAFRSAALGDVVDIGYIDVTWESGAITQIDLNKDDAAGVFAAHASGLAQIPVRGARREGQG